MPALSIVIPAYNEAKHLHATLNDVQHFLDERYLSYEIIVALSQSSDHSEELLERLAKSSPKVRPLFLKKDKGKGDALKAAFRKARSPWILYMNADNSVHVVELEKMLPFRETADLIIGSRKVRRPDGADENYQTRYGKGAAKFVLGWGIHDPLCPFKLISKRLAKAAADKAQVGGSAIDLELIAIAKSRGYQVEEITVTLDQKQPKPAYLKRKAKRAFSDLLQIKKNLTFGRYLA